MTKIAKHKFIKYILLFAAITLIIARAFDLQMQNSDLKNKNDVLQNEVVELKSKISNTPEVLPIISSADLYDLINKERTKNGLNELYISFELQTSACAKATDMIAKNYWAHVAPDGTTPWDFINASGYKYLGAGENLASGHRSASAAMSGWVASKDHMDNIVGDYKEMGLCIIQSKLEAVKGQDQPINIIVNHFGNR